jgi:Xaa-Pro aminopeptidase
MSDELYPASRLSDAAVAAGLAGLDALLLTPGPDLRYVVGYDAHALERLTCLAVVPRQDPFLVVPRLELPAAQASPAGRLGIEIVPWDETDDPYSLLAGRVGNPAAIGLSDRMWALMVLRFRAAFPEARQELASLALGPLRAHGRPGDRPGARERTRLADGRPYRG